MTEYDCFVHNAGVILAAGVYSTAIVVGWVAIGWEPVSGVLLMGALYLSILRVWGRWDEREP